MFLSAIKVSSIPLNGVLHLDSAASYPLIQNTVQYLCRNAAGREYSIGFIRNYVCITRPNPRSQNNRTVSGYGRSGKLKALYFS
jgi:hypothetical protein